MSFFSCEKYSDYSPIPEVNYDTSTVNVSDLGSKYIEITLDFIDGDGDLCFKSDTIKNLVYTLYQYKNDSLQEVELVVPYKFAIPYYVPEGRNKLMRGKIKNKFYLDEFQNYDTIQFSFYVFDRAGNKSKINKTPLLILDNYR